MRQVSIAPEQQGLLVVSQRHTQSTPRAGGGEQVLGVIFDLLASHTRMVRWHADAIHRHQLDLTRIQVRGHACSPQQSSSSTVRRCIVCGSAVAEHWLLCTCTESVIALLIRFSPVTGIYSSKSIARTQSRGTQGMLPV